ncbi:inorganic phosphate transporter [Flavobacteriaceae bacterium]|nr:inorganic phosphate transporter [Flavobacteriaceae bacterium]MDC0917044.1 inorganic phosphate transporter [Flavobacteriaceae bacterium]MDC3330097.1 inorganic phosphate transporter [Flavobacteriaceae bacterium]
MDNIYLLMLVALAVLAVLDIVVGVSNDAINFLNSAIGSKAISLRTIMIVASLGIFIGAVFSSGMMEVARKGIFNPGEFYFDEIMVIFMAVIITDILLLDFFNTLGLPTSTTVSIVFNLLGASVVMSIFKILDSDTQTLADLGTYINTDKAVTIISGILLSVLISFSVGAFVQWLSRIIFTFQFEKKVKNFGALFGGVALTSITYFIFIKGLKGTPYYSEMSGFLKSNELVLVFVSWLVLTLFSYFFQKISQKSILIVIILVGTFGLALAFSGNDLVNFIGVSMAAYHSYEAWSVSGIDPSLFSMESLDKKVPAEPLLLFLAGGIMVVTLWFSKKAKTVAETEIGLSRQHDTHEKFKPNLFSRGIVNVFFRSSSLLSSIMPKALWEKIEESFDRKDKLIINKDQSVDAPAFDMIRASVNLMVAGILISVATAMKLPLSTTYVTFMVAMGTSLADRAWGRESAVYRVAGVLSVIGGWFLTAIGAFIASGIVVYLIRWNKATMIPVLLLLTIMLLIRNFLRHKNKSSQVSHKELKMSESSTVQGIISESADNIVNVVSRAKKIYATILKGLSTQDSDVLKKSKKGVAKLDEEIEELRDNIFFLIKNLDETSVRGSSFYILILAYLTDIAQSLEFISKKSYKHVNNQHQKFKFKQFKDLMEIEDRLNMMYDEVVEIFNSRKFERISLVLAQREEIITFISEKINAQIDRTRSEESSPKNTTLYFNILLETKDLVNNILNLLEEYHSSFRK